MDIRRLRNFQWYVQGLVYCASAGGLVECLSQEMAFDPDIMKRNRVLTLNPLQLPEVIHSS